MSRPDRITLRWTLFLTLLLAAVLVVWRVFFGPLPTDEIGLAHVSRWWILLEPPVVVLSTVKLLQIGGDIMRPPKHAAFWASVLVLGMSGLLISLALGLPEFAEFTGFGAAYGLICLAAQRFLPPFGKWIRGWKIWPAAKRWLTAAD